MQSMLTNSGLSKLPFYLNSLYKTLVRCLEEKLTQTNPEGWRSGQHEQKWSLRRLEDNLTNESSAEYIQKMAWVYPKLDTKTIM